MTESPGLRRITHDAVSHSKVSLSVAPGEVLLVSGDIAGQLTRASGQFKDVTDGAPSAPVPYTDPNADDDPEPEPAKPAKRTAKKRAAKS